MRTTLTGTLTVAALALAVSAVSAVPALASGGTTTSTTTSTTTGATTADAAPLRVVGLTSNQSLVVFRADSPGRTEPIGRVRGLRTDRRLVGIDFRVQNGRLYGVGDRGGVYVLNTSSARATKVSQLSVELQGRAFGVDFNPAANRLRVISDTGQNLRHNIDDPMGLPATGTTAKDGTLTNPPVPPATAGVTARGVTGAAYTNNDLTPGTSTTLFDADTALDQVSLQSPANAGSLAPAGKLGVDAAGDAGFDVYSTLRNGTTVANDAFAALRAGGAQRFYGVDLLTGRARLIGTFPRQRAVVDIAVPLNQR